MTTTASSHTKSATKVQLFILGNSLIIFNLMIWTSIIRYIEQPFMCLWNFFVAQPFNLYGWGFYANQLVKSFASLLGQWTNASASLLHPYPHFEKGMNIMAETVGRMNRFQFVYERYNRGRMWTNGWHKARQAYHPTIDMQ